MAPEKCRHPSRAHGVVELDFSRVDTPGRYSVGISVGVCEQCGHVELYAKSHQARCDMAG